MLSFIVLIRRDIVPGESFFDFRHGNIMLIIRLLQHDLCQTVQLEFLIRSLWHVRLSSLSAARYPSFSFRIFTQEFR